MEALWEQGTVMTRAMEEDCWVMDTVLALAVAFMSSAALPPTLAMPAPWQLPAAQQQVPLWA